jgi:hypothetical protein
MFDDVVKCLGEPYYRSDRCLIFNMDCVGGLKKLKDQIPGLFDLTVSFVFK